MISLASLFNVSYITILSFKLDISLLVVDLCVLTKISRSSCHATSKYQLLSTSLGWSSDI
jgi:hypothetical protein